MYDIPLIKSRLSCIDYAQRIGLPIRRDGDRCKSPLRDGADNKSAFSVHNDYWHDFVSGESGDVIDLAALVNHKGDRGLAIQELARITGVFSEEDYIDWRQRTQRRVSLIQGWHEDLRPQDREYLHSRRITDETINRLRIGYTEQGTDVVIKGEKVSGFASRRIVVPAYKNGYVVSWVARAAYPDQTPKYLKPPIDDMTEYEPWGLHTLDRKSDTLYIAEGCFDALSLDQSGVPVLSTMGGYFGKETLKNVLAIAKDYKQVVLTFDNDDAGRKFTIDFGNLLFARKIPFAVAEIPNKYKDIADYYADGNEIESLALRDGITHLAKSVVDKEEFKAFAYRAARIMDRAELAELFSTVGKYEHFGPVWLKEIQASCFKAPPEPVVVREILKAHKLLYVANVGFYEYVPQGKWTLLNDEVIHGYISDTLGGFTAGGKLEPIKKLMRPEVLTTQEFDRKPVVNFINGTLELDTGNFREHSRDDYCSIQLPYPYLPDAKAERWAQFISEITAGEPKRQENLQFIAGYALFNDCRHEKIFVLTGEGSNGKTIFTKVLEQLYGKENVTNIDPIGLTEAFERIHLRSSLLNIAGEIKSDLSSTEEKLKQIASGESIQACYKGKDFIKFKPRVKMIFCCNGQLRSSDTSDGLARRLIIIDFPCKFVEFPDKSDPYQYEKDIGLLDKLLTELPGIFNWAYQGYKDLLKFGSFTETDEHEQLMRAFRQASNPVEVFIDDLMDNPPQKIIRTDLYSDYRIWCEVNGHKALSSTKFYSEFGRCTRKAYAPYERSVRTNAGPRKERGYELIENEPSKHSQKSFI
jgi:putative DNA primase/helicase